MENKKPSELPFTPQERMLYSQYVELAHSMQAGVAYDLAQDPSAGTPKHLRVGVNSAMADHSALVGILLDKGVFTRAEYLASLVESMAREKKSYEDKWGVTTGSILYGGGDEQKNGN